MNNQMMYQLYQNNINNQMFIQTQMNPFIINQIKNPIINPMMPMDINNQIYMNDFLIKSIILYKKNNNLFSLNNINNHPILSLNQEIKPHKRRFPNQNISFKINSLANYNGPIINLLFTSSSGQKTNICTPDNIKVQDVLYQYVKRIGLHPKVISVELFFTRPV